MNILILDDTRAVREMLALFCARHGAHNTNTASSIKEAQAILENFSPDVVFSDYHLPDGKGISIFGLVRERNPRSYIILSSAGLGADEGLRMALEHGADVFFPKTRLPGVIRTILNGRIRL